MKIDILTIFPKMVEFPLKQSLIGRALEKGIVEIKIQDIRDFAKDKHATVDDVPFGGGSGMVMKMEPLTLALESVLDSSVQSRIVLTTAQGRRFDQKKAKELSLEKHLVIICGHYKGIDERIKELFPIEEISIGDYVLTGGEFASLVIVDAVVRLIPGVLGDFESAQADSFLEGILGYPEYTRPKEFRGKEVPEILLSGDHKKIRLWRREKALRKTLETRPELLQDEMLSPEDLTFINKLKNGKI
ncbi:MAG: tRNA (guanosine(37)-N1)-methyltransferase TrmD [candidate division Zixibacteria bacterium]|nr:tRNA (guanosine(37)-N1)-methyltransferase TrmD [candidate division Zixibacteria bacterium]